jgi:hypothetical protein
MDDLARSSSRSRAVVGFNSTPWVSHGSRILDARGQKVADAATPEDAERIAACVNACAGISIRELQAGILEDLLQACARTENTRVQAVLDRLRRL